MTAYSGAMREQRPIPTQGQWAPMPMHHRVAIVVIILVAAWAVLAINRQGDTADPPTTAYYLPAEPEEDVTPYTSPPITPDPLTASREAYAQCPHANPFRCPVVPSGRWPAP